MPWPWTPGADGPATHFAGRAGPGNWRRRTTRRARETAKQVNQLACSAYVLEVTGIYWYCVGNWDEAHDALGMAAELSESLGDMRRWDETLVPLAMVPYHHGDFPASAAIAAKL